MATAWETGTSKQVQVPLLLTILTSAPPYVCQVVHGGNVSLLSIVY